MLKDNSNDRQFHDLIDEIITKEYDDLVDYAAGVLAAHGARYVSDNGRAEDVVQEAFAYASVNREKFMASPNPVGWMIKVIYHKALECLKSDRVWKKHATQMAASRKREDARRSLDAIRETISPRDFYLLWMLHAEGRSYREMSEELGEKVSTLAMRARRAKDTIRKKYKTLEDFLRDV